MNGRLPDVSGTFNSTTIYIQYNLLFQFRKIFNKYLLSNNVKVQSHCYIIIIQLFRT